MWFRASPLSTNYTGISFVVFVGGVFPVSLAVAFRNLAMREGSRDDTHKAALRDNSVLHALFGAGTNSIHL